MKKDNSILFVISGLHFQKDDGAKNRLNSFIESYSDSGYDIKVLLFYSIQSFRYTFDKNKYLHPKAKWSLFPMIPIGKMRLLTKLSRLINQFVFFIYTRVNSVKLIQVEISGLEAKWKPKNSFLIVDFHGDSVSEVIYSGNKNAKWLSKWFIKEQKESIRYANHIIVVSENLKRCLEENTGISISNHSVIPCAVDIKRFSQDNSFFGAQFKDRIVVGYIGGLQKWQNIESIIDMVIKLREINPLVFFILFTNDDESDYKTDLDLLGNENYLVKGLTSADVGNHLSALDAGFLIRENQKLNIVSSPTKIAEYLAAGVPLICTQYSGDYDNCIEHNIEGFVLKDIHPTDEELIGLNSFLKKVKANRNDYSEKCKHASTNRSWANEFGKLLEDLKLS